MPIKGMGNVKKAMAKTKSNSNLRVKAIFFDGLSEIIKETPVDTDSVRKNWFLTTGHSFSLKGC